MPKIWLIGGAAFLVVLLAASVVVALTEREEPLPEGTPERAVQLFLVAAEEEDLKTAYALLSEELKEKCSVEGFASKRFGSRDLKGSRVTLEETKVLNGSVVVIARVTRIQGSGPFGTSESSHEERFTLSRDEGEWRFTYFSWPYYGCGEPELYSPYKDTPPPPEPAPTPEPAREATPSS